MFNICKACGDVSERLKRQSIQSQCFILATCTERCSELYVIWKFKIGSFDISSQQREITTRAGVGYHHNNISGRIFLRVRDNSNTNNADYNREININNNPYYNDNNDNNDYNYNDNDNDNNHNYYTITEYTTTI